VRSNARGGRASARAIQFFQSGIDGNASEDRLSCIPNAWVGVPTVTMLAWKSMGDVLAHAMDTMSECV
jgi:hypothetical protein